MREVWRGVLEAARLGMRACDWIADRADKGFFVCLRVAQRAVEQVEEPESEPAVGQMMIIGDMVAYNHHFVQVHRGLDVVALPVMIHTDRIEISEMEQGDRVTLILSRGLDSTIYKFVHDRAHPLRDLNTEREAKQDDIPFVGGGGA